MKVVRSALSTGRLYPPPPLPVSIRRDISCLQNVHTGCGASPNPLFRYNGVEHTGIVLITDVPKSSTEVPSHGAIPRLSYMLSLHAQDQLVCVCVCFF
jgi:hypothetical protein